MSAAGGLARRVVQRPLPEVRASTVLRLVPNARTGAPRAPFVTLVVVLLAGGLLGLLALNTLLAQGAFRVHALTLQGKVLADREQVLQRDVEAQRTPRALADRATALGMVPAGPPAFLRLQDGVVLGDQTPAGALPPAPAK
jgi:hypothetical protein